MYRYQMLMWDASLPSFSIHELLRLIGYLDVFTLACGAIAFKSKLQPTVVTNSTEAKFVASVGAGKVAKYLCSVLFELGFARTKPTPLYVDNQATIAMINERKDTPRSRRSDIRHFAIQEWRANGDIEMHHIPDVINPSDQAAKALGCYFCDLW